MEIFVDFLRPVFSASRVQHVSDLHPKFALSTMYGSMADIQSATAKIRRGKKKKKKKIELECGPMSNVIVALSNIGGALCSTPQSLARCRAVTLPRRETR